MKKEDFYKTDLCVLCSSPLTRYYESVIRVTSFKCESCKLNNNYFLHSIGLSFDDSHDISIYYDKMKIFFGDYGGIYYSFKEYGDYDDYIIPENVFEKSNNLNHLCKIIRNLQCFI